MDAQPPQPANPTQPADHPAPAAHPQTPASDDDIAIKVRGLVKRFDGRAVLNGIDLDVRRRETLVIMGGSGCGKSTLLRHLVGSMFPDEGTVEILGTQLTGIRSEDQLNEVRKRIGILFQSGALFNSMTLRENIALPLQEHSSMAQDTIDIIVTMKLQLVGLLEHGHKYPAQISGGMKKRAGLARAMAMDPQILFYDEPSAGLDPVTSAEIDQLIIRLSKELGVTSVVVTHEMDSAFTIADRMVMLDRGRVLRIEDRSYFEQVRDGTPPEDEDGQLIRQFLRGDADGPITARAQSLDYENELLGRGDKMPLKRAGLITSRIFGKDKES